MSLIRFHQISRRYQMGSETIHALREVSLVIERGEYVALMGPSGSGKSTLMNLVGCLDTPTSGRYELNGVDVSEMNDRPLSGGATVGGYVARRARSCPCTPQSMCYCYRATQIANI